MSSRLLQLSDKLDGLLTFARPGEMFEKYSPYSPWVQDRDATGIRKSVTRRKIPEGAEIIGGVPHIREVDAKGVTALRPAKARELIDVGGYKREKHKLLIKTAQPELDKKLLQSPTEESRRVVKREHLAGIRKQLKQPPSETHKEISRIRGSMASELKTTHRIIGGIRNEAERRGVPRPIGIPGNLGGHGIDRPFMISEHLPDAVRESKGKLDKMVQSNIERRTKRSGRLEGAIRKRLSSGIQRTRATEGRTPHPQNVLNAKVHEAMEPFMRKTAPRREEYGSIAGYMAKPGQRIPLKKIERTRSRLDDLNKEWDVSEIKGTGRHRVQTYRQSVEEKLIKTGRVFQPSASTQTPTSKPKSFPHLKKIGIGAAVAAGVATAAVIKSATNRKKKSQPIAMSATPRPIEFARGDIYTAVKTNLIGGTKLINAPKKIKQRVSLRIAAAKGDAPGFRARIKELGLRKMQVVSHRMQTERDRAAAELRGLRIGANAVKSVQGKLQSTTQEVERLQRKVNSRGARIAKLRGETVSPGDAFKDGQRYGETIGAQRESLKSAGARSHFDKEIGRVAREKDESAKAAVNEIKAGTRKKIAIGTGIGSTVGVVAGYETGKERKKKHQLGSKIDTIELEVDPNRRRKEKPEASVASHAVTGGLEGALGIYAVEPALERFKKGGGRWHSPFKDTAKGHLKKISIGAVAGAAATAPIGWIVEKERQARHDRKLRKIEFATTEAPSRGAVVGHRYRKQIQKADRITAESSYLRSMTAGATLSALLRKKTGLTLGNSILAGAGAGAGVQGITRIGTSTTKDQFGDRSYNAKRADRLPAQIGGAAVIGVTGKRLIDALRKAKKGRVTFSSSNRTIQFDQIEDYLQSRTFRKTRRAPESVQAEKIWVGAKRGTRLLRDVTGGQRLDARGRPKTREWEKPWVRNVAAVAILGATIKGVHGARKFVHGAAARDIASGHAPGGLAKLSEVIKSGALRRAAENKIPGFRKASNFMTRAKEEAHVAASDPLGKLATKIEKAATSGPRPIKVSPGITKQSPTGVVTHIPPGSEAARQAERRRQQAIRKKITKIAREGGELSSKIQPIHFAERIDDWDIRDPRGRSARVYAPGSQRRYRRPKRFHERRDNQRVIHQAELGGALVAGTLLAGANRKPIETTKSVPSVIRKIIPTGESALEKLLRETRVRRLSSKSTPIKLAA